MLGQSKYLFPGVKESIFRRLIRWAYTKYLDELYIPEGTVLHETSKYAANRHYRYIISVGTSRVRRGQQEYYFK